jgi:hypothetical protein
LKKLELEQKTQIKLNYKKQDYYEKKIKPFAKIKKNTFYKKYFSLKIKKTKIFDDLFKLKKEGTKKNLSRSIFDQRYFSLNEKKNFIFNELFDLKTYVQNDNGQNQC